MAGIVGRNPKTNDLILELGGREFQMEEMNDTQFADWVRISIGLSPMSCGDDARGRRNTGKPKKTPKRKAKPEPIEEVDAEEPEATDDELMTATEEERREEFPFKLETRIINGQEYTVKVYESRRRT